MRLFTAILLNEDIREALLEAQGRMYDCGMRGSYAREENLHLTLAFIGEYPDPDRVLEAMGRVRFEPFEITPEGIGRFGDLWWAGIRHSDRLAALVKSLRHVLADEGIPFDRKRFSPHITLLRRARLPEDLPAIRLGECSMKTDRISLMRSDRGKKGMVYTEVGSVSAVRHPYL